VEQVHAAREAGFSAIYSGQHFLASDTQMLQTVPLLSRLAAEAGEMTIGTLVLLIPLLNPVYVAEEMATLDVICNGNFVFGVGLGYRDVEFEVFGVRPRDRVERFLESLEIVRRLWTEDHVTHEGRHFQLRDVTLTLKPLQSPPPIWVGASSDAAVRRAARLGLPWILTPNVTASSLRDQWQLYRRTAEAAGVPLPAARPIRRDIHIGRDRKSALAEARPYIADKFRSLAAWGFGETVRESDAIDIQLEQLVQDRFILGDPEDCIEQIAAYQRDLGVTEMILRLQWPGMPQEKVLRTIRLLGEQVIPRFTASAG
jgi:alkanesulfonate monooxygenase SsuD/methylene tetrahydromethanopterin reductase-like flavin-dependent oxidoreductase (luciferase family)